MGLLGLSSLPPSIDALLAPGERVLAWESAALWGDQRIGRTGRPRAITGVNLNPIDVVGSGVVEADDGLFDRWLSGVALTGAAGSLAAGLGAHLDREGMARVAVTTGRLVLVRAQLVTVTGADGRKVVEEQTTALWSTPRHTIRSATHRPRPLMASRLVLEFVDGSTAALMCGVLSPRPARRLRAALQPSTA